jgi:hypothetical protein
VTQRTLGYLLYACGKNGIPGHIVLQNTPYRLCRILKHDFWAATSLYESQRGSAGQEEPGPAKIVLKMSRSNHVFGLPFAWLGELISSHEVSILQRLAHLHGTPRLLGRYGKTGFMYEYIEGCSLKDEKELPDDFFDQLHELLRLIHQRNVVYVDMNKRSNILLGADGHPYIIDFQISLHIGEHSLFSRRLSMYLRKTLQHADIYHLFKHKRRLSPELLSPQEEAISCRKSGLIRAHRMVATPLRELRRALLRFLHAKRVLVVEGDPYFPEDEGVRSRE